MVSQSRILGVVGGSLGGAKVVRGIATWGDAWDQPWIKNLLGYLPHLHKALLKCFRSRGWGARGYLPYVPDIAARRIPPEGSLAATLVLGLGGNNG